MTELTGSIDDQAHQAWRNKNDIWQAIRSGQAALEASQLAHPGEDLGDARRELDAADRQYTEIIMTYGESNYQGTVDAWSSAQSHLENFVHFLPARPADPFANDPDPKDSELGPDSGALATTSPTSPTSPDSSVSAPGGSAAARGGSFPVVPIILVGLGLLGLVLFGNRSRR